MPSIAVSTVRLLRVAVLGPLFATLLLAGCSNGRGSVGESAPVQEPPPTPPPTTPPEPPPTTPPPTTPPEPPPSTPPPVTPPPPGSFSVGGTVSGLASPSGVILRLNNANDLAVLADGNFTFGTALVDGTPFQVSVAAQPTNPAQTCELSNNEGIVSGGNVANVAVTCSTRNFAVGGTVTGLQGRGLALRRNGTDSLPIASNGAFTFEALMASGSSYEITVGTQPDEPAQTCTVANASGVIGSGDVRNVRVTCATNTYSLGGTVSGLEGAGLVLENSGQAVEVESSGAFTFPTKVSSGGTYNVTVRTQPRNPTQACSVSNGSGAVRNQNIANIAVTCTTTSFTVGGTVGGLAGSGLRLQNNGADDLAVSADGAFTFATAVPSGRPYNVTIAAQPTGPAQVCTLQNASGTIGAANVTNVSIQCVTTEFTVGGTTSGLAGAGLVLQNNGADNLAIAADGPFTFSDSLPSGTPYTVSVLSQPSNPTQVCTVASGTGTVANANITSVGVSCQTSSFNVSVTVSNLQGFNLRLQNNGVETMTLNSDGTYTFPTPVQSNATYNVTVLSQPIFPFQTCTVIGGSGTVTNADASVSVTCGN